MSEAERRVRYSALRMMIETARILEPQFNDAVVYLTGAHVELLRNVAHYLDQRDTFVSEYQEGYYLMPTDAEWDELQGIVAELEETLMGNPNTIWGFHAEVSGNRYEVSVGEPSVVMLSDQVPPGRVWKIETAIVYHTYTSPLLAAISLARGEGIFGVARNLSLPADTFLSIAVPQTLVEADNLEFAVVGLPTGYVALAYWLGYEMIVPE